MKTLFGAILLTIILSLTAVGQEFHKNDIVKTKDDSVKVWVVERVAFSGFIRGYVLRDALDETKWYPADDVRGLTTNESSTLNTQTFHNPFVNPFLPNADSLLINGMKPISIQTISPHSSLTFLGVVLCVGGALDFAVAANNSNNSTVFVAGLIGGGICIGSGIGVLELSLEKQTFARYANGMSIRIDLTFDEQNISGWGR